MESESLAKVMESFAGLSPSDPAQLRDYEWRTTIREHLIASRIPPRFHYEITNWSCKPQKATYDRVKSCLRGKGAIVALTGVRGTGKTSIAAQIIIDRAWDETRVPWHRRPPYRKAQAIVSKYKPLYSDFGSVNAERLTASMESLCVDHPLLVIDELHECDDLKAQSRILTDLLDRRYSSFNDTILISNQTLKEFRDSTSDSVLSRLSEHGMIVECIWPSFRDKA